VEDVVKVGERITAKVIECKPEVKRISLSIREAGRDSVQENDVQALVSQPEDQPVGEDVS
jgi:4-hydroxy-3-methylbut-2-enyl diphosphate reductase